MKKKRKLRRLLRRRVSVLLMIVLQIVFLALLMVEGAKRPWLAIFMWGISGIVIVHILLHRSKRVAILPWVILALLFPVFGGLFYLVFHMEASSRFIRHGVRALSARISVPRVEAEAALPVPDRYQRLAHYLCEVGGYPVYGETEAVYLPSGEKMLEALLRDLRAARRYIFLEFFIIEDGVMWGQIHEILKEKAASGVEVRLIYDDIGCFLRVPQDFKSEMSREGIECRVFNPFRPIFTSLHNHRDHRKIVVIDGEIAFTGGVNLADEYINAVERFGHWKDAAVRLSGNAALSMCAMFLESWSLCREKSEDASVYLRPAEGRAASRGLVQPYADSPLDDEPIGERVYISAIAVAEKTLYITTPYFVVDDTVVKALLLAAKSGVDVRIVTPHIYDKRIVHLATRSYYSELIRGGVRVYEYERGFIHSKTLVADGALSVVGTTNFDYRSLCHHFECGTVLYGKEIAHALEEDFASVLAVSREITLADCQTGFFARLRDNFLRIFAPML